MIRTPEARRRIIPKTQDGYKLGGAMLWVVIGIVVGIFWSLLAAGLAWLRSHVAQLVPMAFGGDCIPQNDVNIAIGIVVGLFLFVAMGIILFFLRKLAEHLATPRYGEFAADIRGWFCFGSLLAYGVCGLPAILVAAYVDIC